MKCGGCKTIVGAAFAVVVAVQVDAADDMWSSGRAAGSKMLLEDVDADDDLVPGLGAAAAGAAGGGAADLLQGDDSSGAAAMDASS